MKGVDSFGKDPAQELYAGKDVAQASVDFQKRIIYSPPQLK